MDKFLIAPFEPPLEDASAKLFPAVGDENRAKWLAKMVKELDNYDTNTDGVIERDELIAYIKRPEGPHEHMDVDSFFR